MKRRSLTFEISLLLASALAAIACSSSTTDAATSACQRFIAASRTECTKTGSEAVESNLTSRGPAYCARLLTAPGSGSTPADLDACSAALEKLGPCDRTTQQPSECKAKAGTRPDGTTCGADAQCQSLFCNIDTTQVTVGGQTYSQRNACGTCAGVVAENAACKGASERCVPGFQCLSGKCLKVALGDVGAACGTQTSLCNPGLLCDTSTRKCVARKAAGEACLGSFECEGLLGCVANTCGARVAEGGACVGDECERPLTCDGASQTCVKVTYAKAGEACTSTGTVCEPGGGQCPELGTCPTIAGDGEACELPSAGPRQCNLYATCRDGKCVLDDPGACK